MDGWMDAMTRSRAYGIAYLKPRGGADHDRYNDLPCLRVVLIEDNRVE